MKRTWGHYGSFQQPFILHNIAFFLQSRNGILESQQAQRACFKIIITSLWCSRLLFSYSCCYCAETQNILSRRNSRDQWVRCWNSWVKTLLSSGGGRWLALSRRLWIGTSTTNYQSILSLLVSSPDPGIVDQVRDLGRKMASCFLLGMLASGEWVCVYITYVCAPHSSLSLDVVILPPRIYRSEPSSVCQRVKGKDLVSRKPVSFVSLADQFLNHIFAGEGFHIFACVVAQHALRRVSYQPWCSWCKPFESLNKFGKGSLPFYYELDSANYAQAHLISFIFFTLHPLELSFSEQPLMISLEGTARAWLRRLWSARDPKRFTFWNPGINIMIHLRDGT